MNLFCLNGYNGEKISLELNEVIGFPNNTNIEGGYDIICTLIIDSSYYHIKHNRFFSATDALYSFSKEINTCYTEFWVSAEYHLLYENDLIFNIEMTSGGHAFVPELFKNAPTNKIYYTSNLILINLACWVLFKISKV